MFDDVSSERHQQILKNEKYAEIVSDRRAKHERPKLGEPTAKPACKSHAAPKHEDTAAQSMERTMEEVEAMLNMYSPAFHCDDDEPCCHE